jgi:hypothetical protein
MLFRKTMAAYCEKSIEHINTLQRKNHSFSIRAGDAMVYHFALKGWVGFDVRYVSLTGSSESCHFDFVFWRKCLVMRLCSSYEKYYAHKSHI